MGGGQQGARRRGGGATGVELTGELAEMLPEVASGHGLAPDRPAVLLVEAGPTILAGSSPQLIDNATRILSDLGVQVRTNTMVAAATEGASGSRAASWWRAACSSGRVG